LRRQQNRVDETKAINIRALEVFPVFHTTGYLMCLFLVARPNLVWISTNVQTVSISHFVDDYAFQRRREFRRVAGGLR
jgi:hypothetical protein